LFDLTADPWETKNLIDDPEHKEVLAPTSEEFDRQVQVAKYVVPKYAGKVDATSTQQPRRRVWQVARNPVGEQLSPLRRCVG
jgi:hypothetical protein